MSKILKEIQVNSKSSIVIIDHYMKPVKENGQVVYTHPEKSIGKCKGSVYEILLHVEDKKDESKINIVKISASGIKLLYEEILKIEALESEEFID